MPLEILEKIIGLAIFNIVWVAPKGIYPKWKLPCRFTWEWAYSQWPWPRGTGPAGLLLVSKQIGRVARKILAGRLEIEFLHPMMDWEVAICARHQDQAKKYFEKMLGAELVRMN
jgi:hypothetical protein